MALVEALQKKLMSYTLQDLVSEQNVVQVQHPNKVTLVTVFSVLVVNTNTNKWHPLCVSCLYQTKANHLKHLSK